MRRFFRASPVTIFLVAVLIAIVVVGLHSVGHIGLAAPPTKPAPGASAITPTRPGQVPSFTESDVRAYLARFPFRGDPTTTGLPATVTSVQFITREQAEAAMNGESLSEVPPGALVCYVVLTGHFNPRAVGPMPADAKPRTDFITSAHMVFDAATGNLLVVGY